MTRMSQLSVIHEFDDSEDADEEMRQFPGDQLTLNDDQINSQKSKAKIDREPFRSSTRTQIQAAIAEVSDLSDSQRSVNDETRFDLSPEHSQLDRSHAGDIEPISSPPLLELGQSDSQAYESPESEGNQLGDVVNDSADTDKIVNQLEQELSNSPMRKVPLSTLPAAQNGVDDRPNSAA